MKPTVSTLREVKLLKDFSDDELEKLIEMGTPQNFETHSNVVVEGELTWGLFVILQGVVGIYKTHKLGGGAYDVGQLREGNFFGEMSLIDESPRSATVRALTPCELFHISKESFSFLLNSNPGLKLRFYESCVHDLVSRLREIDENYVVSQYQLWRIALKNSKGEAA